MQSAYTLGRLSGVRTATRWKAYKFREAVIAVRLEEEKERIADWPVVHHNSGPYLELARQGKPFILVTGHFAPLAGYGSLNTFPVASVTIAHGIPGELSLVQQRIVDYPTSTGANVRFVLVGEAGLPAIVARQLTTPGTMIVLTIDVRNNHKPHWRPFAGYASYPCHPYAARLARLAQCPVVFNNVTWDKSGRVRVEWSNLFDPPARHDQAAETALTDALFDELEAAIGRHPTQYAWTTGFDRYWDSQAGRWRNHGSA
jgi:lauroyl/myristoyl acyltransferase